MTIFPFSKCRAKLLIDDFMRDNYKYDFNILILKMEIFPILNTNIITQYSYYGTSVNLRPSSYIIHYLLGVIHKPRGQYSGYF